MGHGDLSIKGVSQSVRISRHSDSIIFRKKESESVHSSDSIALEKVIKWSNTFRRHSWNLITLKNILKALIIYWYAGWISKRG